MQVAEGLSCQELVELVTDYLEGAQTPETRERFETHIGGCDEMLELDRQGKLDAMLGV